METGAKLLNTKERRIIRAIEFNPESTADELSRVLSMKSSSVSYSIRRLLDDGLLKKRAFINGFRLGYTEIAIYFSLIDQSRREEILNAIVDYPHIAHLSLLLGDYNYLAVLSCKELREVPEHFRKLFAGRGDLFSSKLVSPRLSIHQFPRKFLGPEVYPDSELLIEDDGTRHSIDKLDSRLLEFISSNGLLSIRDIARSLGSPASTIERRLNKLRSKGVIQGYYYALDTNRLGYERYRILIMQKGVCASTRERLIRFCKSHPLVTGLVCSLGAWDYEIVAETSNSQEVIALIEQLNGTCGVRIAWSKVLRQVNNHKCARLPTAESCESRAIIGAN